MVVTSMFILFSIALVGSLVSNRKCHFEFQSGRWISWRFTWEIFLVYFSQGRYRLVGMLITWVQNQSVNPILMWVSGPVVAGYFSMARLLIMPIAVMNQGLINSTTPELRRIFESSGVIELYERIIKYNLVNIALSSLYLFPLGILHFTGVLNSFIPDYDNIKWYLLIWAMTTLVTMYRGWHGQFFVVSLQFQFLMRVSVIALLVSMTGMVIVSFLLGNIHLALLFIIFGEFVTISLFSRRRMVMYR
jgi:O-antigen/teichoic acid export membrane protein